MKLPYAVEKAMKKIMDAGGQAFLVGGALRDWLLGLPVSDYDIATSFLPGQVEKIFSDEKTWPSGKRFGTITVEIAGTVIEITTFRRESGYSDSRHPDKVTFVTDIHQDLSRRDFTVNAMAYNPFISSSFVDPFGGRKDLQNRIIRTVGNPFERFTEDPFRIMRGVRLAAQLGFEIERDTESAMKNCSSMIRNVSAERIRSEFDRLLLSQRPDDGLLLLQETSVLPQLLGTDTINLKAESCRIIRSMEPEPAYRLSALFSILYPEDFANADRLNFIKNRLTQLRYDKKTVHNTLKLLAGCSRLASMDISLYSIRELLGSMGTAYARQCIKWYEAICQLNKNPSACERARQAASLMEEVIRRNDPVFFHQLAVDGNHIKQAGIGLKDPRIIGEALNLAYRWVLEDPARNDTEQLIAMLKKHYSLP